MLELETPDAYHLIPVEQWTQIVAALRGVTDTEPIAAIHSDAPYCTQCFGRGEHRDAVTHEPDCPWVAARALVDELETVPA